MKIKTIALLTILLALSQASKCAGQVLPPAKSRLGMNLAGPCDWTTEYVFVDVFRMSRQWISQKQGANWGKGPELDRDENGWINKLEDSCWAETPILTSNNGHAPSGQYVCLYEGQGEIDFTHNSTVVSREPGRIVVNIDTQKGGTFLALRSTNPTNHVRNIRVIMPGFEQSYKRDPYYPPFLRRWQEFNTFRFMEWMETNGSKQKEWSDRATPSYCNYTERGMPVEVMVDLCNRLKINPWFCLPHGASDDYVANLATLVKKRLDPTLKVYIEYSNEVWNGMFEQHRYAENKGQALKLGPKERPWEGVAMYYGKRSQEIFKIWEGVFNGHERLYRVIAWQAAGGEYWSDAMLLGNNDTGKHADVLAIAPYITLCIGPTTQPTSDDVSKWTVDRVLDFVETNAMPESIKWINTQKKVANKYGLKLACYEAGQHLVGVGGGENNEAMTSLFHAANRHPRMGAIYRKYLDAWRDAGGDLMCIYASTGVWSKWGSFSLTEYLDETERDQPKFKAVMEWNHGNPRSGLE
ncbi:MAG: hypothetical protein WCS52_14055 [bacterium]